MVMILTTKAQYIYIYVCVYRYIDSRAKKPCLMTLHWILGQGPLKRNSPIIWLTHNYYQNKQREPRFATLLSPKLAYIFLLFGLVTQLSLIVVTFSSLIIFVLQWNFCQKFPTLGARNFFWTCSCQGVKTKNQSYCPKQ